MTSNLLLDQVSNKKDGGQQNFVYQRDINSFSVVIFLHIDILQLIYMVSKKVTTNKIY